MCILGCFLKVQKSIFKNMATWKQIFICFYVLTNSLKSMTNKPSTLNWWKLEDHNICKTNSRNLGARYGFFSLTKFFLSGVFYQNLTVSNKTTLFWFLIFQSLCLWVFIFCRLYVLNLWKEWNTETYKHLFRCFKHRFSDLKEAARWNDCD